MYTFSNKLKTFSIALIILGLLGVGYGFMTSHKSFEEVETILADEHHGEEVAHADDTHAITAEAKADQHKKHVEHVQHQIANRPWAAIYVAAFFFMMIALGVLAFYAVQRASQAGWSPVLFRVMEGISTYLLPGGLIVLIIAGASHFIGHNNIFVWMDPEVVAHDKLIQGKAGWLNVWGFLIRGIIYLGGWVLYSHFVRKFSIAQDTAEDNRNFKKAFRISAAFLVFFLYTESMMSWDWIMSVDPHWFSTLFGWYVLAGMLVSGITVIAFITLYLKSRGYLEHVNDSHLHDLAKFMFGFSIFWAYLWFSQFMLIWYANIPEEVTYFVARVNDYKLPFFGMVVLNLVFPFLMLMNSDYKRLPWFVVMTGVIILVGHYVDVYTMIMPATVGDRWSIGIPEISSVLLFAGLFIFIVFNALTKAPLLPKRNPFIKESENFHY
ncbi:quinol:cytochrome C oxidoreductase [Oceanihabitans sediminis]|uniref:Quinol:cytochrome C oxidoreductase n=1 Tax=Oceanihabitans sediminis TaxID=1812012 RepID=A0A368P817_9FLAO|nr:quinol:cytochrome C oxidoreductase [Oceanihabitans sediminis]MDX1278016.1 quinol:cytochrome C oxidoreductase [Oceanihabitans sediminis]MDX1772707.1 quinol:cytochrome C oxidoreductase [Oceanihabitans sediminis]RBP34378.1 quinol:cytochrome c oxidoreductase quinone-binding subunit 2 [Oceanihabitans sediminis]RCU58055.1 quinol:cytochrome C oxidoreductase [Oceanihabitans sediminis]